MKRIFITLAAMIFGTIIWFIHETFSEIDNAVIHPREEAW